MRFAGRNCPPPPKKNGIALQTMVKGTLKATRAQDPSHVHV